MNLISIRYHKIVDFESLFFVFVKIPGKANREDIHPVKSSSKRHRFKPFEFRVKTANNLYCIVLSTYIPIQFAMSTPKSFALWRILQRSISERSSQWFIDFLFITRDSRKSNKLCEKSFTVWMIWNSRKAEWLHTVNSFLASVFLPHIL